MRATALMLPLALTFAAAPAGAAPKKAVGSARIVVDPGIAKAVADPGRPAADRARDKYRHPAETLSFFGLKPTMTVIELYPSAGWYSAILAPYLAPAGRYLAAVPPGKATDSFTAKTSADAARYGKANIVAAPGGVIASVEPGSADMILTFRNIHNMMGSEDGQAGDGTAPQAFASWFAALKPGGVLGIVEHRLPETMDAAKEKDSGYLKRSTVLRLAMAAGFQLAGASDVNANPKDTHDWPKGVWTLPPNFAAGDQDRAKYAAVGESDRMTLRFVKPGGTSDPAAATDPTQAPADGQG